MEPSPDGDKCVLSLLPLLKCLLPFLETFCIVFGLSAYDKEPLLVRLLLKPTPV